MNTETLEHVNCPICDQDQARHLFTKDCLAVVECRNCGLRYVNPRMSAQSLETNYIGHYYPQEKIELIYTNAMDCLQMKERLAEIERQMHKRGRLLDVGCGIGTFLHLARERGWEIYGADPSESGVSFARDQYGLDIFCGNLFEANFPDQYFDAITLYHVLEHVPQVNPFLEELRRILKQKTGCLAVEVPNAGSIKSRLQKEDWPYVHPRDHLYYFSHRTLSKLLHKHGFNWIRAGKPERVNPDREGTVNVMKFTALRVVTAALVNLHLSTVIRIYASYDQN